MMTDSQSAHTPTAEFDHMRCRGCGSVVPTDKRRQTCFPVGVDVTQPGYRYLADTWGYCFTLGRHVGKDEPNWLDTQRAAALRDAADEVAEDGGAWDVLALYVDEAGHPYARDGIRRWLRERADRIESSASPTPPGEVCLHWGHGDPTRCGICTGVDA